MSSLIVEVCRVDEILPHPNADRMAVARIKGWYVCIAKNAAGEPWCREGENVVYFPPDCIVPPETSDRHGTTKYLTPLPQGPDGVRPRGGRVRVTALRGFRSYGYLAPPDDPAWEVGRDVSEHYGITKYEPPVRHAPGEEEGGPGAFHTYYGMENIRNFPHAFVPGEEVVCTEKIHGENCRLGLIRDTSPAGPTVWKWMAGSRSVRRNRLRPARDAAGRPQEGENPSGEMVACEFWRCFSPGIRALLAELAECGYAPEELDAEPPVAADGRVEGHDVVLFGERFGAGVQDLPYGFSAGEFSFRAFDVTVDGKYLDFDAKQALFARHGIPTVPLVYRGPFSFRTIEELAEGPALALAPGVAEAPHFREGIVVQSIVERPLLPKRANSRAQVKCLNFAYLARAGGTEFH